MKENLSSVISDKLSRIAIILSAILIVLQTILISFSYSKFPPLVPLLNSQPWGEKRLFESWVIFSIPLFLVLIFIFNNCLSVIFYKKNTLISRILSFNVLLVSSLTFFAFIQIIFLVF